MVTKAQRAALERAHLLAALASHGVSEEDYIALRRAGMTLRAWYTQECNGTIQRDEATGLPYAWSDGDRSPSRRLYKLADRERGAERRIAAVMAKHPTLAVYLQTDPRGAAVYILRPGDVPPGEDPGSYYTRGLCVV